MCESIEQTEWIINILAIFTKMISVILLFQMSTSFFICFVIGLSHLFDIDLQCVYLLFGNAAYSAIFIPHTDILQVVQFAKDTHLTEFADTCDKKETDILALRFQRAEEIAHNITNFYLQFRIVITVQHGSIIFIYKYHNWFAGLCICALYDSL